MSSLTAVETYSGVVVVGSDLAGIVLWVLHGVLVVVLFKLGSVLHGGLEPGHGVTEASLSLGTFLLLSLVLHEFALVFFLLFCPGSLCEDGHVHEGVEIRIDLRGKQSPQFRSQALLEHVLLLRVLVHFFGA